MAKKKINVVQKNIHVLLLLACLFVGIGLGMILGNTGAGAVLGAGAGFLATYISKTVEKKKKR